jgi:hypothetical protein
MNPHQAGIEDVPQLDSRVRDHEEEDFLTPHQQAVLLGAIAAEKDPRLSTFGNRLGIAVMSSKQRFEMEQLARIGKAAERTVAVLVLIFVAAIAGMLLALLASL